MEITTFDDDLLGLSDFAERLQKFIEIEHRFVRGSLVIGLNAKFGAGKTTFLDMWKHWLGSDRNELGKPMVVDLNAWESDYYGDPLFAVVSSLIESLKKNDQSTRKLVSAAKDVGWFATAIGGQVVKKFTGIDAVAAGDLAEKKKTDPNGQESLLSDTFSIYQGRKDAMNRLQNAIRECVPSDGPGVWFLVDELDRCRPDYAISYLETIKHIFDAEGAVFILAVDRHQLENSAKTAFGPNLNFDEYYRKFVHREVILPHPSEPHFRRLASKYVDHYLRRDDLRHCYADIDTYRIDNIASLIEALKLTPRQIQEVFRVLGHVFETSKENEGRLLWCIGLGTIAMAAFKVGMPRIYHLLGSGDFAPGEAYDFLNDLLGRGDWWFTLFLTGGGLRLSEDDSYEDTMAKVGMNHEGKQSGNNLAAWSQGWGHHSQIRFPQIHDKIEQVDKWK